MLRWATNLIIGWALLGGVILLLIVLMTTYSAAAGFLIATPFPGDFELTEMGVAVASFAFLPYCQLTFANVSADVFTAKMSPYKVRILSRVGSLVAAAFSILLIWRMYEGLLDY
ncbi:MAG: TRAP transporter small permease subunit, partial [Deltaproteobacteria bacterium]